MSAQGLSQEGFLHATKERRKFPRMKASSLVRFNEFGAPQSELKTAELHDYSAIGLRMICDTTLFQNSKIKLLLIPGNKSLVPSITAEAIVVRCGVREDHHYEIACKFTKVKCQRRDSIQPT